LELLLVRALTEYEILMNISFDQMKTTPLTRFARYSGRRLCLGMALMSIHFRDITVNFEEVLNRFGK